MTAGAVATMTTTTRMTTGTTTTEPSRRCRSKRA
jgi:hypothetical protein